MLRLLGLVCALLICVNSQGQSGNADDVIRCFDLLFNETRFDSSYYSHEHIKNKKVFLILHNEMGEPFAQIFTDNNNLLQLPNGYALTVDSQGMFFVLGIKRYLKFENIKISDINLSFSLVLVEYNGVKETIFGRRMVNFEKLNDWKLTSDKIEEL